MKIIFVQGNHEEKYHNTRHNVGFLIADAVADFHNTSFKSAPKFFADIAEFSVDGQKNIIAKPTTYYNETGRSFIALKQFYKADESDILIIHDELALPFGTLRSRVGGSDAGNNGIKSINANGGENTARLRIGVGSDMRELVGDTDFVLGRFNTKETEELNKTITPKALELIDHFLHDRHEPVSHTVL